MDALWDIGAGYLVFAVVASPLLALFAVADPLARWIEKP